MNIVSGVVLPFRRLYEILPKSSKRRLPFVVLVSLVAAVFETASVASILPFMAIVMDPGSCPNINGLRRHLSFSIFKPNKARSSARAC